MRKFVRWFKVTFLNWKYCPNCADNTYHKQVIEYHLSMSTGLEGMPMYDGDICKKCGIKHYS